MEVLPLGGSDPDTLTLLTAVELTARFSAATAEIERLKSLDVVDVVAVQLAVKRMLQLKAAYSKKTFVKRNGKRGKPVCGGDGGGGGDGGRWKSGGGGGGAAAAAHTATTDTDEEVDDDDDDAHGHAEKHSSKDARHTIFAEWIATCLLQSSSLAPTTTGDATAMGVAPTNAGSGAALMGVVDGGKDAEAGAGGRRSTRRVLDVAGGKGLLSLALVEAGLPCVLIDPCMVLFFP
jgi:hypothetical protein